MSNYLDKKIQIATDKILTGERDGSFVFESAKSLRDYIEVSHSIYYQFQEKILKAGFRVKETSLTGEKIQNAVDRILEGDREGSFVFVTVKSLCEYLDVSLTGYYSNKEKIFKAGFRIVKPALPKKKQNKKTSQPDPTDKKIQDAADRIRNGEREGSFDFVGIRAICRFVRIDWATFQNNKEKISKAGFRVERPETTDEKIQNAVDRILEGDREGSFVFESGSAIARYIKVPPSTFKNNKERILRAGFQIKKPESVIAKLQIAVDRILEGDRGGSFVFETVKEASNYIGITSQQYHAHRDKILKSGVTVKGKHIAEISKNTRLSIRDCQSYGIKIESIDLLPELSQEFFSRSIHSDPDQLSTLEFYKETIVFSYEKEEVFSKIKEAALNLISSDKADYSMLELKLELFMVGIYLSEETIMSALMSLGEDINGVLSDNIYKRLRLCISFVQKGLVEIEYAENLPPINNSSEGNVIIDKGVNNRQDFMRLWREYVQFSIENRITGYVSKTKIHEDWNGDLQVLFKDIPSYQKAYLLDDENIDLLAEMGYEGILAMCQFGSKQPKKNLVRVYHSIHARCMGFFLYLNRKGLALFHPKYFIFTGASSVSAVARKILEGHVVLDSFKKVLESPNASASDLSKLRKSNVELHAMKFAGSVPKDCNLETIPSGDIYSYLTHSSEESVSGVIKHDSFALILLRLMGNRGAIEKDKIFNIEEEIENYLAGSSATTEALLAYKELLGEMLDVVRHFHRKGQSNSYIKSYLRHIFNLMIYLSIFPKKLNRKEMSEVLNTIILSKDKKSFMEWSKENLSDSERSLFTNRMYIVFDAISGEEYAKLYNKEWRILKGGKKKRIIREGMDPVVLETLQRVAIHDAPNAHEYPFYKTTPDGQIVDLSWWKYDFSPIPVICNWLITKTTRRKIAIRHLDVNTFLQYDEDGQIKSFYINTDKNRNSSESEINIHLLRFMFTDEELYLLEKYVEYIQSVYSSMSKVAYGTSSEVFDDIMPLFPHHEKNTVIAEAWVDGYYNKTLLKTELLMKKYIAAGEYDHYFEEHERETKKKMLLQIKHLKPHSSGSKLPETLEELDNYSLNNYRVYFTSGQGVHNMRHAGISVLGAKLPLVYVRIIAGHSNINTTARIYFHASEEIIGKEVLDSEFGSLSEPVKSGSSFVDKIIMPLVESNDPKMIENELFSNNFMSFSREVAVGAKNMWVENGVELASAAHPATWARHNYGICPNAQCPPESRGCCGLCPYLIYSPMHLKGIVFELNNCMLEIAFLTQKIALDATKNINTSREKLSQEHQQKIVEMLSWMEVEESVVEKIRLGSGDDSGSLPSVGTVGGIGNIISFRGCSLDESMMEQLVDAAELKINNIDTDNYIARISNKMLRKAIKDGNPDKALKRMEKDGMKRFIGEYGKKTFFEKKECLLQELGSDEPIDNSAVLDTGMKTVELLPVG